MSKPPRGAVEIEAAAGVDLGTVDVTRRAWRTQWVLRRVAMGVAVLFAISIIVFAATQVLPGDPSRAVLGNQAPPKAVAALNRELGLYKPAVTQYVSWLTGILGGNLGESFGLAREPVSQVIGEPLMNSMTLLLFTATITVPLALITGCCAAIWRDKAFDKVSFGASLGLTALPEFIIGMMLVILFATTWLHLFPAIATFTSTPFSSLQSMVLPVATLVLSSFPYLFRLVRASMIDVLESEYVQMARFKGMPESIVVRRHALPNAVVAAVQGTALTLSYLLGGVVVVEYVFNYPGLGSLLSQAIESRDIPLVQIVVLIFAAGVVFFNLLGDVITFYLSPRSRTAQ